MSLFTMKLSDQQRDVLKARAGKLPIATYIKSLVLAPANSLDDEEAAYADLLRKVVECTGGYEAFMDALMMRSSARNSQHIADWLQVVPDIPPKTEEYEVVKVYDNGL